MDAILLRVGVRTPAGYALTLYAGEELDVLARAAANAPPDKSAQIPADLSVAARAGVNHIDLTTARAVLAMADGVGNALRDLGLQLFGVLDRDDVGQHWRAALARAGQARALPGVHLRTWLDVQDPTLARLPWELLRDNTAGAPLAAQEWTTLVRFHAGTPPTLVGDNAELRALVVIGCDPEQDRGIAWLDELRSVLGTLCPHRHAIDFEVFEARAQTIGGRHADVKQALQATIKRLKPHLLHFVGHGRLVDGEGALELYNASTGQAVPWTTDDVAVALGTSPPRLVLLNACRTSTQAAADEVPIAALASVSGAALAAGVAGVVAMQHDIGGPAAAAFAEGFYTALVEDRASLDQAVAAARTRIGNYKAKDWALPVCTLTVPPDQVLPALDAIPAARRQDVRATSEPSLRTYVDRRRERRAILDPGDGHVGTHVAFIVAGDKMGKSGLASIVSEWRVLMGHAVMHVAFDRVAVKDALNGVDVLRSIRGVHAKPGDARTPYLYPHFADFNDALNAILANRPAGSVPATGIDNDLPYDRNSFKERGWDVFGPAFLDGLRRASVSQPLTIVLDHFTKTNLQASASTGVDPRDFSEHIIPRLLLPLHRAEVPGVSLLISATEEEIRQFGLESLQGASTRVARLNDFDRADYDLLAREFTVRIGVPPEDAETYIRMISQLVPQKPWKPRSFETLRRAAEGTL